MTASWGEFETRRAPVQPDTGEYDRLVSAVFSGGAGAHLLALWRGRFVDRALGADATESALRTDNAHRRFVLDIEAALKRAAMPTEDANAARADDARPRSRPRRPGG